MNKNLENVTLVDQDNYHSATNPETKHLVEKQILTELIENRYVIVETKPQIVSAIGAILKPGSNKVRLIHDASRPTEGSLNSFAELGEQMSYESIQTAIDFIEKDYYMAKLDLKSAYRSVPVHPDNYPLTGLKWRFIGSDSDTYMIDTRLPFGCRLSPLHFHKLTKAVKHMMIKKGCKKIVVYLDDFLIIARTKEECMYFLNCLIKLVRELGFSVAWDKIEGPSQRLKFLGIILDSKTLHISLPLDKVNEFKDFVVITAQRQRVSLRRLQKLAGKLNWATIVLRGGRIYTRKIFDAMKGLKQAHHKIRMSTEMRNDLSWWVGVLDNNNLSRMMHHQADSDLVIATSNQGAGITWQDSWAYVSWEYDITAASNCPHRIKELAAMSYALNKWGESAKNHNIRVFCQHVGTIQALKTGSCKEHGIKYIREIYGSLAERNIQITTELYYGDVPSIAKTIAHLHEPGRLLELESYTGQVPMGLLHLWPIYFIIHMSINSCLSLIPQITQWLKRKNDWIIRLRN